MPLSGPATPWSTVWFARPEVPPPVPRVRTPALPGSGGAGARKPRHPFSGLGITPVCAVMIP